MERCLPALVWHLEDPRVGQSYPNFYVARLASKFVKVALSGSGGDELFAGYPWRYYRAVVNDDFDDYIEKYYRFWHRLVPNATLRELFSPAVWREVGDLRTIDIFRDQFPDASAAGEPGGLRQPLALPRGEDLPPRAVRRRGQAEHGAQPREPGAVPGQRPGRLRPARAGEPEAARPRARGQAQREHAEPEDRALLRAHARRQAAAAQGRCSATSRRRSPTRSSRASRAPTRAGSAATASTTCASSCSVPTRRCTSTSTPTAVRQLVDDHLEGRANRRLLLWSLLSFEHWCRTFLHGARP